MLAIGCVGLLALSIPALSLPSSGIARHQQTHAVHKNKNALLAAKGRQRAAHLVSTKVVEPPKRPKFGWPALVSEARKYLGTNPTARKRLWCATFMNLVLAKIGYAGTNSDAAKSFAAYGHRIAEPKVGAIAVLSRGNRGGHVGVVSGIDARGNPIIISGNHGHRVAEATYPRARVIAYVMPTEQRAAATQVADRAPLPPNRPAALAAEPAFEGPITELLAAIETEQSRPERPSQPERPSPPERPSQPARSSQQAAPKQPPAPHRVVQQVPQPAPQPQRTTRDLPLDPALAELLGLKDRARAAQPPRPAPQRQQRVQRQQPGRVAAAETGLAGIFGLR